MEEVYERMIAAYQPSERARVLLGETAMVLMVGVSGAGRDTIINHLVAKGGYYPLVTSTTRQPRVNNGVAEQNGVEYWFVNEEQAKQRMEAGEYVEVSPVHDRINGLLLDELQRAHDTGKIAITDMDPQGALKYHELSDNVIAIFVLPPSYEEWMSRNRLRYASEEAFAEAWPRRRESAIMELEMAMRDPFYHFVINDELAHAIEACDTVAHGQSLDLESQQKGRMLASAILDQLRADD
ncbi:MAG: hypothetical protein ABIP74_01230 [Candidatus Saccharimonas sp.]